MVEKTTDLRGLAPDRNGPSLKRRHKLIHRVLENSVVIWMLRQLWPGFSARVRDGGSGSRGPVRPGRFIRGYSESLLSVMFSLHLNSNGSVFGPCRSRSAINPG